VGAIEVGKHKGEKIKKRKPNALKVLGTNENEPTKAEKPNHNNLGSPAWRGNYFNEERGETRNHEKKK